MYEKQSKAVVMMPMKIPKCQSDVTKEWLKYVIKFHSCSAQTWKKNKSTLKASKHLAVHKRLPEHACSHVSYWLCF